MARPLRIEYKNAFYHVMNRGRGRQQVFHDPDYYETFLQCLDEAYQRFSLEIHSYCLMGNHYHLLVKTPQGNLSRAMRHVNGLYTQRYNRLKKTDGPLFRGRYKAIVVDASAYLLQVSRYIHRNPIDMKKPLVKALAQYPWSSYPYYSKKQKTPDWLYQDTVFAELGASNKYQRYGEFVAEGNEGELETFYNKGRIPSLLGDTRFKDRVLSGVTNLGDEVAQKEARQPVDFESIISTVQTYYGCQRQDIVKAIRGRGPRNYARWIAMKLCQTEGQLSLIEIAKRFNVGHYCTVSQTINRLNSALVEDKKLDRIINTISIDLTR